MQLTASCNRAEVAAGAPAPFAGVLLTEDAYRDLLLLADLQERYERGWERCIEQLDGAKQKLAVAEASERNEIVSTIKDGLILGLGMYAASCAR